MAKFLSRYLLTGIVTILPVVITLYIIYWLAVTAESMLGGFIRLVIPENLYWPGMGVVAGLLVIILVGLLMHAYVVQRLFAMGEKILYRMPVINSIYRALHDFIDYFSPTRKKDFEQVVAVTIANEMQIIGFVTQAIPENMPTDFRNEGSILVYLPMSYMIGGYTVLLPQSAVRPINMSMEEAMRFTLTAGVTRSSNINSQQ